MKPFGCGLSGKRVKGWWAAAAAIMIVALGLRLPGLGQRPMHGDEAVQAVKFAELLERGFYRYDPNEYHGPSLNYFTLIPAGLGGIKKFSELNEFTLRIVPVVFGVALVMMTLALAGGLGKTAVILAAMFTAVSPAFVFYSRYYIHEILLVFFTFAVIVCGYRYSRGKSIGWALPAGVSAGLCYATKETCIITFGAMAGAGLITLFMRMREGGFSLSSARSPKAGHIIAAAATAVLVSFAFYSSFFDNPRGMLESIISYKTYFGRAFENTLHIHPWYYYIDILTWMEGFEKLTWNEDLIVVLAVFGFFVMAVKRYREPFDVSLVRFIGLYTLIMAVIYSAIPYKTPWCMLSFYQGMIVLAGVGGAVLIKMLVGRWERVVLGAVLLVFFLTLPVQAYFGSFHYYADTSNPYVYAHTSTDVFSIERRVKEVANAQPDGFETHIQVICRDGDYWPLPWYLRRFSNVGWWSEVKDDMPAAPVIIASAELEPQLARKLYELRPAGQRQLYVPLFDGYTELRPSVELRGYVSKEYWDRFRRQAGGGTEAVSR